MKQQGGASLAEREVAQFVEDDEVHPHQLKRDPPGLAVALLPFKDKRTKKDAKVGQQQAKLYADCLEKQYGQRPVIFCSNGYEHWMWDDAMYPPRPVQGFYKKAELELAIQRRSSRKPLTLHRDEAAMEAIRGAWDTFCLYLDGDNPPPLSEADSAQRDDPAWGEAAAAFVAAKRNADSADEALDAARQRLVDLAMHPRETGGGVSVVRLWKAGNVDYKRIPELKSVDLDRYRGKGREEVRVTVAR